MQPTYPPQGYPQPPAPQYAPAPQGYPAPPAPQAPAYGPPPQAQYAAPAPQAPAMPAAPQGDAFNAPANTGFGMLRPRLEDLNPNLYPGQAGRLVMFAPTKLEVDKPIHTNTPGYAEMVARNQGRVPTKDVVTANLIVLDGGPLSLGGKPEKGQPHTAQHANPAETMYVGMLINQTILVDQMRPSVNPSGGSLVLGRLTKVPTQGAPAWKLEDPTEADRATARAWCAANPGPWSQPPAAYVSRIPTGGGPTPQAAPAAPQGYAPPPPAAPQAPAYPQPPAYAPPPPPAAPVGPVNPGYDPAWWATLAPDAQAYYASQPLPQATPAAGPQPGQQASWS